MQQFAFIWWQTIELVGIENKMNDNLFKFPGCVIISYKFALYGMDYLFVIFGGL